MNRASGNHKKKISLKHFVPEWSYQEFTDNFIIRSLLKTLVAN